MIQKVKTQRERESEKTRGKKRYIERVVEEQEAEQEIKEYDRQEVIDAREIDLDNSRR